MYLIVALRAFWLFIPAYIANPSAVVFGGLAPIDFGKKFVDGRRILGDGKTYSGLIGGGLAGVFFGMIQMAISHPWDPIEHFGFGGLQRAIYIMLALSFGALLGDMLGSFIKRRLGVERGERFPGLDQYDLVLGAFLLTILVDKRWVFDNYIANNFAGLLTIIILTPLLHKLVNIIGYKSGLKNVPW
ncbi:MAG: CDP-2,3-bis-(O-geranylgeranyl)-sn-glycerol synthase [Thermoplasmata archaeon]|nr:MAG: CDP-2,3-bis-(O-geranylgeranyl)-sn-glycerol synthase [Thermoplasmata archaeon]